MHVVYKITFDNRLKENKKPYYYIGSKSNCVLEDGVLYGVRLNRNKSRNIKIPYWGSCKNTLYLECLKNEKKHIEIIETFETHSDCLNAERMIHIENDVVASPEYFNKIIAMNSPFLLFDHASYKNIETNKIAKLPKDHPEVLTGNWVLLDGGRESVRSRLTGAFRTQESINKTNEGNIGVTPLQNLKTGEYIRIHKDTEEYEKLDKTIWVHPSTYRKTNNQLTKMVCEFCGNRQTPTNYIRWHGDKCRMKPGNEKKKSKMALSKTGFQILFNVNTDESKKFKKGSDEILALDRNVWLDQMKYETAKGLAETLTCPWCEKSMDKWHYGCWHGDKCKKNPANEKLPKPKPNFMNVRNYYWGRRNALSRYPSKSSLTVYIKDVTISLEETG